MNTTNRLVWLGGAILVIVLVWWAVIRPYEIRQHCNAQVRSSGFSSQWLLFNNNYQTLYQTCLNSHGL